MDSKLETQLAALPNLSRQTAAAAAIPCKICRQPAMFFDIVDFQKCIGNYLFGPSGVHVEWYRCDHCGFLFTPFFDHWSNSDFAKFIYNGDYVLVDPDYVSKRPMAMAQVLATLLAGHEDARILDFGAGRGLLAESLSELGFRHTESYDPFSIPRRPVGQFDIITCNEVIEHSPFPLRTVEDMRSLLRDGGCILLSEALQPPDIGTVRCGWWYVAPRNGHVSTFTDRTLALIASEYGLIFHRGHGALHALRTAHDGAYTQIAGRVGPSLHTYRLGAPGQRLSPEWSGVEDSPPNQFQWTTSRTLTWNVDIPAWRPQRLQIIVPFVHESRHGFAAECSIEVNGVPAITQVRDKLIVGEIGSVADGSSLLTLKTPDLLQSIGRDIGLGVLVMPNG